MGSVVNKVVQLFWGCFFDTFTNSSRPASNTFTNTKSSPECPIHLAIKNQLQIKILFIINWKTLLTNPDCLHRGGGINHYPTLHMSHDSFLHSFPLYNPEKICILLLSSLLYTSTQKRCHVECGKKHQIIRGEKPRGPLCHIVATKSHHGRAPQGLGSMTEVSIILVRLHPLKFNSSPLKNDAWKTAFLLGFGNFSGASC